ncbi:MAG: hypothetical protein WCD53_02500 [Microcoleus sp.]
MSWLVLRAIDLVLEYPVARVLGMWEQRAMEIFEKSVEIIKIWCKIKKGQISDVTAA